MDSSDRSTKVLRIRVSEYSNLGKVLGWFILLRWIAFGGVLVALIAVHYIYPLNLPMPVLFMLNGALFCVNSIFTLYFYVIKKKKLSLSEVTVFFHIQICCDYILLFFHIYFTGYLQNPFVIFLFFT